MNELNSVSGQESNEQDNAQKQYHISMFQRVRQRKFLVEKPIIRGATIYLPSTGKIIYLEVVSETLFDPITALFHIARADSNGLNTNNGCPKLTIKRWSVPSLGAQKVLRCQFKVKLHRTESTEDGLRCRIVIFFKSDGGEKTSSCYLSPVFIVRRNIRNLRKDQLRTAESPNALSNGEIDEKEQAKFSILPDDFNFDTIHMASAAPLPATSSSQQQNSFSQQQNPSFYQQNSSFYQQNPSWDQYNYSQSAASSADYQHYTSTTTSYHAHPTLLQTTNFLPPLPPVLPTNRPHVRLPPTLCEFSFPLSHETNVVPIHRRALPLLGTPPKQDIDQRNEISLTLLSIRNKSVQSKPPNDACKKKQLF